MRTFWKQGFFRNRLGGTQTQRWRRGKTTGLGHVLSIRGRVSSVPHDLTDGDGTATSSTTTISREAASMLRLFAKRGVLFAPFPIVQQPLRCKRFHTRDDNFPKVEKASSNARPKVKQNQAPGNNDRLVSHCTSNRLPLTQLTNG